MQEVEKVKVSKGSIIFSKVAASITKITGKPIAFLVAVTLIILWLVLGPLLHFSDGWQLVANTFTTLITFLMVFIIQHSQNKDTMALQLKLNELIASNEKASNRLIAAEELTDAELELLKKFYTHLATLSKEESDFFGTHSIDGAKRLHKEKLEIEGGEIVEKLQEINEEVKKK